MKIDKEKYEELLRKFIETVESSEKKFFIAVYIELLSHILQVFRDNKNISISLFLHLFKKKNNREVFVLLPNSEQLLFLHNEVKKKLTQVDIVDKVINLVQEYGKKINISFQLIASEQNKLQSYLLKLQTNDKENQIRKALSSNFWNQTLSGTQYMEEVVNKRRDFFNDSYKIETAIESLTLSKSVSTEEIILEHMILLALESFFTSPDTFFDNKRDFFSLLWGKPVFLHYSRPIGNVAVSVVTKKNSKVDSLLKEENILNDVIPFLHRVGSEIIRTYFLWEISQSHALRSAVAAIMARNMSHQQGSAVIPYLLSLEGVSDKGKILTQYLSYIESRMDFVATAATMEFPKWGISVKFFKDLIVGFISQYGLIECLCKSEGYRYNNIQFKVYINDNEDLLGKDINTVNEKDVDVWIPGGFTGMHAFYLILENIMRNTAKYSKKDTQLIVSIKLKDDSYIVEVWDNLSSETSKVEGFNNTFKESLIKPTGEKREYAWGFAEMRICATYLISGTEKEAAGKLSESEECPIKAIEVDEGGQKRIGYEFKLKKPKLLEVYG
jgi:hypothetical protein